MRKKRIFLMEITIPLGVPADLQSAVKKCSTYKQRGICNPPIKGKAYSFAADFKSANKAVEPFFTPDFKSGGTPSGKHALLSAKPLPAFRAFSLDDEGDGVRIESFRQFEARNMDILHAERTVA